MSFLPQDVLDGLNAARSQSLRKASHLRLDVAGQTYPVLRIHASGFAVPRDDAPKLRGFVDLYDGAVHLFQCLIVAAHEEGEEMHYDFKRATAISNGPARDFAQAVDRPIGLLESQSDI